MRSKGMLMDNQDALVVEVYKACSECAYQRSSWSTTGYIPRGCSNQSMRRTMRISFALASATTGFRQKFASLWRPFPSKPPKKPGLAHPLPASRRHSAPMVH
jgi:hypothetical protein